LLRLTINLNVQESDQTIKALTSELEQLRDRVVGTDAFRKEMQTNISQLIQRHQTEVSRLNEGSLVCN
jgi:hypothetical protein